MAHRKKGAAWPVFFMALAVALALAGASCSTRLVGGLDETEANRILFVLEDEGVAAAKQAQKSGRGTAWTVSVAGEDYGAAIAILAEAGLPKPARPGLARLAESSGIIPTAEEQRGRKAAALGEELSRTIESMRGVLEARVLVSLPPEKGLLSSSTDAKDSSSASVLVRHRGAPSFTTPQIQALVAGGVSGLDPERVTVILNEAGARIGARKPPGYGKVGPILVAPASRSLLAVLLIALTGCNLVLAALLIAGAVRNLRRRKGAPPRESTER